MKLLKIYSELVVSLKRRLSKRQFLIVSSILVGITSGLAAILLKTIVHNIQGLLTNYYKYQNFLYLFAPLVGIILTVIFIKNFLKDDFGKGAAHILLYISKRLSNLKSSAMYSHIVTSSLTVGFGGSAGLEAPIVVTGAAIGSNYGRINLFDYKEKTLLLACGSAAGIAAVFNSPIAGVMFALEVLIPEVALSAFVPLIISAATGTLLSKIILQEGILLHFEKTFPFNYYNVPFYIVLGILAGFISLYYSRTFRRIESWFKPLENRSYIKAIIGGLSLAFLVFLFPPLFGEGYQEIKLLANGNASQLVENSPFSLMAGNELFVVLFIGAICLIKVIATAVTLGGGGNGGNFAPSLFVGAFLGFFFARALNLLNIAEVPEANFTLVGMAGILSGVMYAPLTGIFLIAEVTSGYDLMIPLMIVSSTSYIIVKHFEPYSMDTKELARLGILTRGNKDKSVLSMLHLDEIIEKDFLPVNSKATIKEFIESILQSKRNLFPVVDGSNILLGVIKLESIREILFELGNYADLPAVELMNQLQAVVEIDEEMSSVMKKFDETGLWNMPVVDKGKYIGFVSKSSIFSKYRDEMLNSSLEE